MDYHLKKILSFLCLVYIGCIPQSCAPDNKLPQMVFPGIDWEKKSPERLGVDS